MRCVNVIVSLFECRVVEGNVWNMGLVSLNMDDSFVLGWDVVEDVMGVVLLGGCGWCMIGFVVEDMFYW